MTSIVEIYRRWPTKDDCIEHLEQVRWGEEAPSDAERRRANRIRYETSEKGKAARKAARLRRYQRDPEKVKAADKRRLVAREQRDPLRAFAQRLRRSLLKRCRQKGFEIPENLRGLDFYLAELARYPVDGQPACPCCLTPYLLDLGAALPSDHTPSCDRLDPTKPTYHDNIAIICWRCNRIKQDATAAELIAIGRWLLVHGAP